MFWKIINALLVIQKHLLLKIYVLPKTITFRLIENDIKTYTTAKIFNTDYYENENFILYLQKIKIKNFWTLNFCLSSQIAKTLNKNLFLFQNFI